MKMYWGSEDKLHTFLIFALDGSEWSDLCCGFFTPGESPWYPLDRRLFQPESQLGCGGEEKKILSLLLLGIEFQLSRLEPSLCTD
jgi:hypothetical protein